MSVDVMSWVFKHATVKGAAWQVLVIMADAANEDGRNSYLSRQTIALRANLTEKAVREAWEVLERDGWIARDGWSIRNTKSYRVLMPASIPRKRTRAQIAADDRAAESDPISDPPAPPVPGAPQVPGGTRSATPGTVSAQPRHPRSPEPSLPVLEPSGSSRAPAIELTPMGETVQHRLTVLAANHPPLVAPPRVDIEDLLAEHEDTNVRKALEDLVTWTKRDSGKPGNLLGRLRKALEDAPAVAKPAVPSTQDLELIADIERRYPPDPGDEHAARRERGAAALKRVTGISEQAAA